MGAKCEHYWMPWFSVVRDRNRMAFLFPAARCARCGTEKKLSRQRKKAAKDFREMFDVDFETFGNEHKALAKDLAAEHGALGWRLAQDEDYRLLYLQ